MPVRQQTSSECYKTRLSHKHASIKQSKDHVTLLLCTDKTGNYKLKPLCIGKFVKLHCYHYINMTSMPIDYKSSSKAWMMCIIK